MQTISKAVFIFFLTSLCFACTLDDKAVEPTPTPPSTPDAGTTGYLTGKATNQRGEPLPNVKIGVSNRSTGNYLSETGVTDAKGAYRISLPKNTGDWTASATFTTTYNQQDYVLRLEPGKDNKPFSSTGGVADFQLKLTGRQPSSSPGTYGPFYGGVINLTKGLDANVNMSEIMVYTEPLGPIIDGTTPAPKVYTGLMPDPLLGHVINLPIGHWRIAKITRKDGTPLYIRDYTNGIPDGNVAKLDFYFVQNKGMYSSEAPVWVNLTVTDQP